MEFPKKIGGFYESIGMNDGAAVVHKMIKDSVAQQIDGYGKYIKENPDYAKIAGTDDAWLSKADSFLSSELRKEYHGAADTDNSFSQLQDLAVFTEDAKEILYGQGLGLGGTRYAGISEEELDVNLGITSIRIETLLDNSSISDDFKDAIRNFMPEYNEDIIKKADAFAGEMRNALVEKNGLEHQPINKQSVYDVLEKMTKTYKNTKDAFAAIKDGVQYGSTQFEKKHTSNTDGNARYENSAFWENMFEKKHSYTQKTTLDSILTEMNDFLSYAGQAQGYSENRLDKRA